MSAIICPNCDNALSKDEKLVIAPPDKYGYFRVEHVYNVGLLNRPKFVCKGNWFNRLSFDNKD